MNECGSSVPSPDIRQAHIENSKGQSCIPLRLLPLAQASETLNINLTLTANWLAAGMVVWCCEWRDLVMS